MYANIKSTPLLEEPVGLEAIVSLANCVTEFVPVTVPPAFPYAPLPPFWEPPGTPNVKVIVLVVEPLLYHF